LYNSRVHELSFKNLGFSRSDLLFGQQLLGFSMSRPLPGGLKPARWP